MSLTIQYYDPHRAHERRMTMIADKARVAEMANSLENRGFVVEKITLVNFDAKCNTLQRGYRRRFQPGGCRKLQNQGCQPRFSEPNQKSFIAPAGCRCCTSRRNLPLAATSLPFDMREAPARREQRICDEYS